MLISMLTIEVVEGLPNTISELAIISILNLLRIEFKTIVKAPLKVWL